MATKEKYISDNPFRLLNIASETSQSDLSRKASAAARSAQVGLSIPIPFTPQIAADDLVDLSNVVRSLSADPVLRTVFRIFWPISETTSAHIIQIVTVPGQMSPRLPSELSTEEITQLQFLVNWYRFLQDNPEKDLSPKLAANAFAQWADLYSSTAMDERLQAALVADDQVSPTDAYNYAVDAQKIVAVHMLNRVATEAAKLWRAGYFGLAFALTNVILEAGVDEKAELTALDQIITIGQALADDVEKLTVAQPSYDYGNSTAPPVSVTNLEQLSIALGGKHPGAGGWSEIVQNWHTALGWRMRACALHLNEDGDNENALRVVEQALRIVRDANLIERLRSDAADLREILNDRKKAEEHQRKNGSRKQSSVQDNSLGHARASAGRVQQGHPQLVWPFAIAAASILCWFATGAPSSSGGAPPSPSLPISTAPDAYQATKKDIKANSKRNYNNGTAPHPDQQEADVNGSIRPVPVAHQVMVTPLVTPVITASPSAASPTDSGQESQASTTTDMDALRADIESRRSSIAADEQVIESQQANVDALNAKIKAQPLDQNDQASVSDYNALVNSYNDDLAQLKEHESSHNDQIDAMNTLVDQYNSQR